MISYFFICIYIFIHEVPSLSARGQLFRCTARIEKYFHLDETTVDTPHTSTLYSDLGEVERKKRNILTYSFDCRVQRAAKSIVYAALGTRSFEINPSRMRAIGCRKLNFDIAAIKRGYNITR